MAVLLQLELIAHPAELVVVAKVRVDSLQDERKSFDQLLIVLGNVD